MYVSLIVCYPTISTYLPSSFKFHVVLPSVSVMGANNFAKVFSLHGN